jgi:predicted ABC-type ATPase
VGAEPRIWVVAGPNGGGKSSVIGEMIREAGADYLNPDELTRRILERNPGLRLEEANGLAWEETRRRLEQAVLSRTRFAFETTLGGRTIGRLLHRAADTGIAVVAWYLALESADRHLARVQARVARGGHPVPEARIRERYDSSRANLALLLPKLAALKVYDNSVEAKGHAPPRPSLVLDWARGRILNREELGATPAWAKPIVAAALKASLLDPLRS